MADTVRELLREARERPEYWEQWLESDFTEELCRRMELLGLSRRAFAERINSSPAYVTKVLRGDENLTKKSMAKLARAVGSVVRVHLAPVGTYTVWLDMGSHEMQPPAATNTSGIAYQGDRPAPTPPVLMRVQGAASTVGD